MLLTNKFNLPQSIVNAVANDPYDNKGTLSVTTLLKAPYQRALEEKHKEDIVEDVSDKLFSLLGRGVHNILEGAAGEHDAVEVRYFATIGGSEVSGQFDLLEDGKDLHDYKVTSVSQVQRAMKETKADWEAQLNMLDYLSHLNDVEIESLHIQAFCRDWSKRRAKFTEGYPKPIESFEIKRWDRANQLAYISARVVAHQQLQDIPCTDSERWCTPSRWAVHRKGRKTALRVLDSLSEAQEWCIDKGYKDEVDGISIEERVGENIRCEDFCSVSSFCPHFATLKPAAPAATLRKL